MQMTDATTVRTLKLRASETSAFNTNFINSKMEAGELLDSIADASLRMKIKVNVPSVYPFIPMLFIFYENTKYLEAPQNIMRGLLAPKFKGSIYSAMRRAYTGTNREKESLMIKDDENTFIPIKAEGMNGFRCGYWQLWVRALRDFPDMTNIPPMKERDRQKPIIKEPSRTRWYEFAKMAYKLRFDSEQIQRYIKSDPVKETIRSSLLRIYPPDDDELKDKSFASEVTRHTELYLDYQRQRSNRQRQKRPTNPPLTVNLVDQSLSHRCNRPFENSQKQDRRALF